MKTLVFEMAIILKSNIDETKILQWKKKKKR